MLGAVTALILTVGILLVGVHLLRRMKDGAGARHAGRGRVPLEIVQRVAIGPRQGVALLRVADRVLVVAMADQGTRLLTELEGADRDLVLHRFQQPPVPSNGASTGLGGTWWRRIAGMTALLGVLLVSVAAAQSPNRSRTGAPVTDPTTVTPPVVSPRATGAAPARAPSSLRVEAPRGPQVDLRVGEGNDELRLSGTVGLVVFLGAMTLLPALFLLMTSFTRILIVLHFLRSALGTQGSPPGQLLVAIAVLLTGVVMQPVLTDANRDAVQPYLEGQINQVEAYRRGVVPFRRFMLNNLREQDLATFTAMAGADTVASVDDIPTITVVSAFVTSELRTAFQMGFVIFLPFIVVDLLVASALMSLGMFMLPPVMISLPFKLLLFVLADGWGLVAQNLVASFRR